MSEIKWQEPPARITTGRGNSLNKKTAEFVAQLRENPGRWAVYPGGQSPSMVAVISHARTAAFRPAGAFEAVRRQGVVYVRYVGGDVA